MSHFTEVLNTIHSKNTFECGNTILDNYLKHQASQDIRKKLSVCFVWPEGKYKIIGYYTLSNSSIPKSQLPEGFKHKFPSKYENLPVTLLGRFAINLSFQNEGKGRILLFDALKRSYELANKSIGSIAVVTDPIDENARNFYQNFGFIELNLSQQMFLPMKSIEPLIQ
jgi:hypothetical protein